MHGGKDNLGVGELTRGGGGMNTSFLGESTQSRPNAPSSFHLHPIYYIAQCTHFVQLIYYGIILF